MKRKITTILMAVLMVMTCLAPMTETAFAASNTNSDGTYAGTLPTLPNAIAEQAIKCAWPNGTAKSKYRYPSGSAKTEYTKALTTAYGSRSGWGKQTKAGASCDVFVGTVVRSSGYDTKYPRGLSEMFPYVASTSKFTKLNITQKSQFEPGDIILYKISGGGAHTCIYVEYGGVGYLAEAQYKQKLYPVLDSARNYGTSRYLSYGVYRANGKCIAAITRGGRSTDIKYLQTFLNWAGFNCGTPDGAFGPKTEESVKKFQAAVGLTTDGEFGSKSLEAARTYKKGQQPVNEYVPNSSSTGSTSPTTATGTTVTKVGYTGKFPTNTINKKKGSKTNIQRWQQFLKWYGYPITTGGKFGSATIKYTKAFQKANGLTADGSAGPKTIKKAKSIKK